VVVLRQEAAGVVWDVAEAPQREAAASDAVAVPRQEVVGAAWDAAAEPQREVAAVAWDAVVVPQREVAAASDVAAEPQQEAARVGVAVPRQVVAAVRQQEARGAAAAALLQGAAPDERAALPSAVPWVFRRGPPPLWLAPRPAAQPARAMARWRIATP
jgi:hypothetical protein